MVYPVTGSMYNCVQLAMSMFFACVFLCVGDWPLSGPQHEDKPPARSYLKQYIWPHGTPSTENKFAWPPPS